MDDVAGPARESRSANSMARLLSIGGKFCIFCLAAFIVWTNIGRAALIQKQLPSALHFPLSSGKASALLAAQSFISGESDVSESLARNALQKSLSHVEALSVIGMHSVQKGDVETGNKLLKLSSSLSWRHSQTQAWLFERSLLDRDYAQAMIHADALLRRHKKQAEIFDIFPLFAQDPALRPLLVARLETKPDWRRIFFDQGNQVAPSQLDGFELLVTALAKSEAPVTRDELDPFANLLIQGKFHYRALLLWNRLFPLDNLALAENSEILLPWKNQGAADGAAVVDWDFRQDRHIEALVRKSKEPENPILDVALDRRALGDIARRPIILPPGRLTLDLSSARTEKPLTDIISWSVACADGSRKTAMLPVTGHAGRWTIDIDGTCDAHQLILGVKLGGLKTAQRFRGQKLRLSHQSLTAS